MRVLIAEDDVFFRRLIKETLSPDYEVESAADGKQAWEFLQKADRPALAVLDWVMPGFSGPQLCRKIRETPSLASMYLMILTARNSIADVISGLRAGADDYVTKPFNPEELRARVKIGVKLLALKSELDSCTLQLQQTTRREQLLESLVPVCPSCKKVLCNGEYWNNLESYVTQHVGHNSAVVPCPDCMRAMRAQTALQNNFEKAT